MNVDYLVVGQGISGSLLSRYLLNAGKSVIVVDELNTSAASYVAGGIVNPVTGKRLVRSWMIDELFPFALATYKDIEKELGKHIVQQTSILDFPASHDERNIYTEKLNEEQEYLSVITNETDWGQYFRFNYGVVKIAPCLLVDIVAFVRSWRQVLHDSNALIEVKFEWTDCKVFADDVVYKNITAQKIIYCEGAGGANNPYFDRLPWSKDKGEALIADIPGLPRNAIFKQGISIAPWRDGLFWIGAAHDWKYTIMEPSQHFRDKIEEQLNYWLKLPYTIVDHVTALRPANMERKPFAGLHPVHKVVGILNGFGGKGVSMAPYFAHNFAAHLTDNEPLLAAADVNRFAKILSR